ncbi:MAG: TnsD family Tn7-like transposition protein [Verrucomicrobia bacterium]|nr:TnsD family Tn7-like transposition protein [Verrucomicrobiota bacterium]
MIPFFPSLIEGETLYNLVVRYHRQVGYSDPRHSLLDLFGSDTVSVSIDLPGRIDALVSRVDSLVLTAGQLIDRHTLYPLYASALTQARARQLKRWMRRPNFAGHLHAQVGLMASSIECRRELRACRLCYEEDLRNDRPGVWRTIHQVAGLVLCPFHGTRLLQAPAGLAAKGQLTALEERTIKKMTPIKTPWVIDSRDMALSRLALEVQESSEPPMHIGARVEAYRRELDIRGHVTSKGSIRWPGLIAEFEEFWGSRRLEAIHAAVPAGRYSHWLAKLLQGRDVFVHPIRQLMLMLFLDHRPTQGVAVSAPLRLPFGRPRWPCLNPVCSHYRRLVVDSVQISVAADGIRVSGLFSHCCGFTYRRMGPDPEKERVFEKDQVTRFGGLWEARCRELIANDAFSWRAAAKALGVDVKTVQYRAIKASKRLQPSPDETLRTQWLELVNQYPGEGITAVRHRAPALYTRLYRRDRRWLISTGVPRRTIHQKGRQVDWAVRDRFLSKLVRPISREIKRMSAPTRRASRAEISKHLRASALIERKLDRLPLTSRQLRLHVESAVAFRRRRLWQTYKASLKGLKPLTRSALLWAARIRPEFIGDVEDLLALYLGRKKTWRKPDSRTGPKG